MDNLIVEYYVDERLALDNVLHRIESTKSLLEALRFEKDEICSTIPSEARTQSEIYIC